ncbi:MAG: hypothetical protein HDR31_02055 [Mycoplasma sp.]|nr:hypothetical protein [Mycoplasma sp.]
MKYVELKEMPNEGFKVAASMYGVLDNKIIVGGGSGFVKPLAEGGPKLLSNTIRLLSENKGEWIVHDEIKIFEKSLPYKFCNGASIFFNNKIYYFAGLKTENDNIVPSSDVIEVEVVNNKIKWKLYINVLPFSGEATGSLFKDKFIIACGSTSYEISFTESSFSCRKNAFNLDIDVNGCLLSTTKKENLYLLGGYKPYKEGDIESNKFFENKISKFTGYSFETKELKNIKDNPCVFLGASYLPFDERHILVVGGVNKEKFLDAIYNLSVLKDQELQNFKNNYFNETEEWFAFNKNLILIDVVSREVVTIGKFPHGLAGNPAFIKLNDAYYILNGEVKAGVRLNNPIKFTLED